MYVVIIRVGLVTSPSQPGSLFPDQPKRTTGSTPALPPPLQYHIMSLQRVWLHSSQHHYTNLDVRWYMTWSSKSLSQGIILLLGTRWSELHAQLWREVQCVAGVYEGWHESPVIWEGGGIYTSSKQGKRSSSRALMFIFIGTSTLKKLGEDSIILKSPVKKSISLNSHMYPSEYEYIYLCTLIRYLAISGYIYPLWYGIVWLDIRITVCNNPMMLSVGQYINSEW